MQGSEGSADEYQRNVADTFYLKPYGVSSGALGRRDHERPELITTLSDVGVKGGGTACDQVHFRPSTVLPYGPPSHNRAS